MLSKTFTRILGSTALIIVLLLSVATPALAFDGRGGGDITIPASEVVNDDLYISGQAVVVDGTVKGDLVVFAQTVTVNGTVEGDLLGAGRDIIVNGTIGGAVRIAGATLYVGEKASIGRDLVAAGASLETRKGSTISRDLVFAGGQALLSGAITRNADIATGGLELGGSVGGNLSADVGNPDQGAGGGPRSYITQTSVSLPDIKNGLTLDPSARIGGNLDYTSAKAFTIAPAAVAGKITHSLPKLDTPAPKPLSPARLVLNGSLDVLRNIITLLLVGLLLGWLFPGFIKSTTERLKNAPLPAFGEGVLSVAAFFFSEFVLLVAVVFGFILFLVLSLWGLSITFAALGLLTMGALFLGILVAAFFVAEILVGTLVGQLLLARIKPELAEHKFWPLLIGVVLYSVVAAIPVLGWLAWLFVSFFGLGALWYFGRSKFNRTPAPVV